MAKNETEYGGVSGIIQPEAKGHTVMDPQERAFLARSEGLRGAGMDEEIPEDDLHRPAVDAYIKERPVRLAGRRASDQPGERIA